MKIKFATYNICHCGDYSKHKIGDPFQLKVITIDKTAQAIMEVGADIIGLNEAFEDGEREEFKKQTERLANMAGYPYHYFAKGFDYGWCVIGNAILSKYPIVNFEAIPVPTVPEEERGDGWYEDRVIIVADIDVNGKIVKVLVSHFGLIPVELERIVTKSCEIIDNSAIPCVIMGDFNVLPDNKGVKPIFDRLQSCAETMNNNEPTFSSYDPQIHIDYICVPNDAKVLDYTVHKLKASDHMPISATVELKD